MACRLFGAKPLSEPMLANCWLEPWEPKFCEIWINIAVFEIVVCKMSAILSRPQRVNSRIVFTLLEICIHSDNQIQFPNAYVIGAFKKLVCYWQIAY